MHHDIYFLNSLKIIRQMGSAIDNSHGLYTMLKLYIVHFGEAVSVSIVVIVLLWSSTAAWRRLKSDFPASIPFLPFREMEYFIHSDRNMYLSVLKKTLIFGFIYYCFMQE